MKRFRRWKYKIRNWLDAPDTINRRVKVEQYLWDAYHGKQPLPDKEKCKELAKILGIPTRLK